MGKYDALAELLVDVLRKEGLTALKQESGQQDDSIPVGISNRHVHLSQADLEALFGVGYELTQTKELSQPGQFACKETVTLAGPKGAIEKVRILGPVRKESQVEILAADNFKLGTKAPIKQSGDLAGTPGATLIGPRGSVQLSKGLMVAQRHIHMTLADARRWNVTDGQVVSIQLKGNRGGVYAQVLIRANDSSALECHLDTEEANAMALDAAARITILR